MIESQAIADMIEKQIRLAVDQSVESYVSRIISELSLDPQWLEKIENLIKQNYLRRFDENLAMANVSDLIGKHIDEGIERWQDKLKKNFQTAGISDQSDSLTLTVTNDGIVTNKVDIDSDARVGGTLTVHNLAVKGAINVNNASWDELKIHVAENVLTSLTEQWQTSLVQQVLDLARQDGIDFETVTIQGQPLVTGDRLNPMVRQSYLESVGRLHELTVSGPASISDTLNVDNRRVGINTDSPEMALGIWDEEVALVAGKIAPQQAYIGTSRAQKLSIGTNRTPQIEIDTEGMTTVKQLRIGNNRIAHEREVPGYSGTKGDIVFNSDPRSDTPFAWICLGAYRWQPLRSA